MIKPTSPFGPFPEIHIVCTNRGQHDPKTVNRLEDRRGTDPPGPIVPLGTTTSRPSRRTGKQVVIDRPSPIFHREDGSRTFTFLCTHEECVPPRNVQRRMEKLGAVLDRLYAAFPEHRRYTLDISYMD